MNIKKIRKNSLLIPPLLLSAIVWVPLLILLGGSFMGFLELKSKYGPVLLQSKGTASLQFLPQYPTLRPYIELLLDTPAFFVHFWNSVGITVCISFGQLVVATLGAWWFSQNNSRFSNGLFVLYTILMLMPFQVTMVSNYLVVDALRLLGKHASIILPTIFSTFPVFIIYRFFKNIPETTIEAAEIDGARQWQVFFYIGVPMGKAGIMTAVILAFLEGWNMIEQPMVFLKDKTLWPISLFLPEISAANISFALAASVVSLLPALLVFLFGQEYLEQGISHTGAKE